ncbi:MAG: ScyD/ScyE family protein [Actinomycetota bacterium]
MSVRSVVVLLVVPLLLAACASSDGGGSGRAGSAEAVGADLRVVADGLVHPLGLAALPDGSVLVAEQGTGRDDDSAGVSVVEPDGTVRRVVDGLPSTLDSGDLAGAPLVGVDPTATTAYVGHFNAERLLTFDLVDGAAPDRTLSPDELDEAMIRLNDVWLVNPFDVVFDRDGTPVVTDASGNGLATEQEDGTVRFLRRFDRLVDPATGLRIDPVPTGLARSGDEYLVALFSGCPYPAGAGRVVSVDVDRGEDVVVDGLTLPIDVEVDQRGRIWVLTFADVDTEADCFSAEAYRPGTGRLSMVQDGDLVTVAEGLDQPGGMALGPGGRIFVSELRAGRVLEIRPTDDAAEAGAGFVDRAEALGLGEHRHAGITSDGITDPSAAMSGGLCWLDVDADGWLDLLAVNSHPEAVEATAATALFRNDGGRFVDVSAGSGIDLRERGNGCVAGDVDGDGDVDAYVTADGPNRLFLNDGTGVFTEVGALAGVDAPEWSTAAALADVDDDGDLDLFVGAYLDLAVLVEEPLGAFPQDHPGLPNRLYRNDGVGADGVPAFLEVGDDWGLDHAERTLGALFTDVDGDGTLDLFVANDGEPNRLHLGDSDSLVDVAESTGADDRGSGMGVAAGDWDSDGSTDLFVTNWDRELHGLYRSVDDYFLNDASLVGLSGMGAGQTGWGTALADLDLDADLDLFIANGRVPVVDPGRDAELLRLFENRGEEPGRSSFVDVSRQSGLHAVGELMARGAALADFDNDGDLDVAVATVGGPLVLLENRTTGRWLTVESTRPWPGTTVIAELPDGRILHREIRLGSSYLASEDPRVHVGLGGNDRVAEVRVVHPDGTEHVRRDVLADQVLVVPGPVLD